MELLRDDNVKIRPDEDVKVFFENGQDFVQVRGNGTVLFHQITKGNKDRKPGVYGLTWMEDVNSD